MSELVENFGFAKPTGSEQKSFQCLEVIQLFWIYLNEGVGEPWAGHVNEIPSPADILKADRSTIEENFGLADPMGSELERLEKKWKVSLVQFSTWMQEPAILELGIKEQGLNLETF